MALKNPFAQLVKSAVPRLDWFALYRGKVLGQSGNTVDVQPDDARLPAMSKVPLRHGLPGVSVSVQPGTSILVGWENGDPSRPYACLWEGGEGVIEIKIAGSTPVARQGDNLTASAAAKTWAGKVELALNSLAPGTFDPATSSFASPVPGAPGAAGGLGAINQGSPTVKVA